MDMMQTQQEIDTRCAAFSFGRRVKRVAVRDEKKRWRKNTLVYFIPNSFNTMEIEVITGAMEVWANHTCLRFRKKKRCYAQVGMIGRGEQKINLGTGCVTKQIVIHEIGHAIGLHHTQSRSDRDNYVTVNLSNVNSDELKNFCKATVDEVTDFGIDYDYHSIMHYGKEFSSNNGKLTIIPTDPSFLDIIGTKSEPSFGDIKMVNTMYNCHAHCPTTTCPDIGFLNEDCICMCPGDPTTGPPIIKCNTCPTNCKDGSCDQSSGRCAACDAGYFGADCSQACSANCKTEECDQNNGNCAVCNNGYWGDYCTASCPMNCRNGRCKQSSGRCSACDAGYSGLYCRTVCKDSASDANPLEIYWKSPVYGFDEKLTITRCKQLKKKYKIFCKKEATEKCCATCRKIKGLKCVDDFRIPVQAVQNHENFINCKTYVKEDPCRCHPPDAKKHCCESCKNIDTAALDCNCTDEFNQILRPGYVIEAKVEYIVNSKVHNLFYDSLSDCAMLRDYFPAYCDQQFHEKTSKMCCKSCKGVDYNCVDNTFFTFNVNHGSSSCQNCTCHDIRNTSRQLMKRACQQNLESLNGDVTVRHACCHQCKRLGFDVPENYTVDINLSFFSDVGFIPNNKGRTTDNNT